MFLHKHLQILYLDTISEIIAPLGLSGPPRVGDMQQAAAGAAPAATVVQMEEVEMEIVAKELEMAQVEVVAATQTWSQWLLYGPVDLSFFVPMFGSRGARIFYAAFPWTAPISFAICMAVTWQPCVARVAAAKRTTQQSRCRYKSPRSASWRRSLSDQDSA